MIKNNLRDIRMAKDLSQEDLAEKSGISRTMISALESQRKVDCKASTLVAISKALETPVADIFLL